MAVQTVLRAKRASGEAKVKAGGSVRTLEEQKQIRARRRAKELEMVKDDFTEVAGRPAGLGAGPRGCSNGGSPRPHWGCTTSKETGNGPWCKN